MDGDCVSKKILPRLSFRALSCRGTRHLPTNLPRQSFRVCHSDEGSISPFFISTGRCLILRHDKLRVWMVIAFQKKSFRACSSAPVLPRLVMPRNEASPNKSSAPVLPCLFIRACPSALCPAAPCHAALCHAEERGISPIIFSANVYREMPHTSA